MSTKDYKRSKKRVYALKDGFTSQKFKLKRRFNTPVLANIIFPIAFFFNHSTILSEKRVNSVYLKHESEHDCYDYLVLALDEKKEKKKLEYLRLAISQDYRNQEGVRSLALKEMIAIQIKNGELHEAYLTMKDIKRFDSDFDLERNMNLLKDAVSIKNNKKIQKEEKWNQIFDSMNTLGASLTHVGESMESAGIGTGNSTSITENSVYDSSDENLSGNSELAKEKQKLQQLLLERESLLRQRSGINQSISSTGVKKTKRTSAYLKANHGQMRPGQGNYGKGTAETNIRKVTDNRVELRNINKRIEQCQQRIRMYEDGVISSGNTLRSNEINNKTKETVTGSDLTTLHADQRSYESYETQILNMKNGYALYNDSDRRNIQSTMKNLRTKWEQRGQVFPHSNLESWLGK